MKKKRKPLHLFVTFTRELDKIDIADALTMKPRSVCCKIGATREGCSHTKKHSHQKDEHKDLCRKPKEEKTTGDQELVEVTL